MQRFYLLLLLVVFMQSCKNGISFEERDAVFRTGDNPAWAHKDYDDSGWRNERGNTGRQVFWTRHHVQINQLSEGNKAAGVEVYAFGAYEIYWDGVRIGQNGSWARPGKAEIPGTYVSDHLLPDTLSNPGKHVLALRGTQVCRSEEQRGSGVKLEYYSVLLKRPLIITSAMNLMAGAFLMVALYYLFLYVNSDRKSKATLIFCITCFLFFILLIAEYIKYYIAIPYTLFYVRLESIGLLTFATAMLIPGYFSIQFSFRRKLWLNLLLFLSLLLIYVLNYRSYDLTAKLLSGTMWIAAVIVTIDAVIRREKGSIMVLAGLALSMVVNQFLVYDFGIFVCFTVIVLCMLYLHAVRTKENEKAYEYSLLLSARLKLELLKKNIQPHFIKNTLTSLIDWVEESPEQGVIFIKALAAEFDIMNEISEEKLIPVSSEITLCRAHLSVMYFRKEVQYVWQEKHIDPADTIPPAVIHTLLENGITHSRPLEDGSVQFELSFERGSGYKQYTLLTRARNREDTGSKKKSTGFQYIAARLTESYGTDWAFESAAVPEGWSSQIRIYIR